MRKTSSMDSVTRADERMGYIAEDALRRAMAAAGDGTNTVGGGTSYPYPYFGPTDVTYWRADNSVTASITDQNGNTHTNEDYNKGTGEDNVDGASMISWWVIPNDTVRLTIHGYYVKANGTYGRKLRWQFDDITDDEAAGNFCERTLTGLRPGKVFDIVGCRATLSDGSKAPNPVEPDEPSKIPPSTVPAVSLTDSMLAWPNPLGSTAAGYGPYSTYPTYSPALASPFTAALARIDLRNYALLVPRITNVASPEKEPDGTYYPVTVTYLAGLVDVITIRGFRVGRKGPQDYSLYGKQWKRWRFQLDSTQRDAGTAILKVGPFGPRQAKQPWHLNRIHATDFRDETVQGKRYGEWYPALLADCAGPADINVTFAATPSTDLDSAYQKAKANSGTQTGRVPGASADGSVTADTDDVLGTQATNYQNAQTSDGSNSTDTGTPAGKRRVLGVLAPGEVVDGKLAGFSIVTEPDLQTEKEHDAFVRFSANIQTPAGAASTAGDANATQAVFIFYREDDADARENYIRKRVDLNPSDDMAECTFHRKIGRKYHMKKMRLKNGISKVDTDLKTYTGTGVTSGKWVAGQDSGGAYVGTDAISGIGSGTPGTGGVTLAVATGDTSNDETHKAHFTVSIVNQGWTGTAPGTLPVIPKRLVVYVSKKGATSDPGSLPTAPNDTPSSGNWRVEKIINLRADHDLVRIATVTHQFSMKLRRNKQHWIKCRLYVAGDDTPRDQTTSTSYTAKTDLPVKNYAHGHKNMLPNSGFLFSERDYDNAAGSVNVLGRRWAVDIAGTPAKINNTIKTTDPYWDDPNHRLVWKDAGSSGRPAYGKTKRLLQPGETLTCPVLLAADAGLAVTLTIQIEVVKVNDSNDFTGPAWGAETTVWGPQTITATAADYGSTFEQFYVQDTVSSPLQLGANQSLYWKITVSGQTNTHFVYIDNAVLARGDQVVSWDSQSQEETALENNAPAAATASYATTSASTWDAGAGGGNNEIPSGGKITL